MSVPSDLLSGFEALRQQLERWGLSSRLAQDLWQMVKRGDPPEIIEDFIFSSREFANRFAGIFDADGNFRMTPAEFVSYEQNLKGLMATYGFTPRELGGASFEEVRTALVSQNRSLAEVAQDFEMFAVLEESPFIRQQFFAFSGIDPGTEGLFAMALGLPEGDKLKEAFQKATGAGVTQADVDARMNVELEGGTRRASGTFRPVDVEPDEGRIGKPVKVTPKTSPQEPETIGGEGPTQLDARTGFVDEREFEGLLTRIQRLRAFRQATAANQARFRAGGGFVVEDRRSNVRF